MKKFYTLISFAFLFNTTEAQLSGNFTIGDITSDYSTIQSAIDDLKNQGIDGPVVLNIQSGSYNEAISISNIQGTSSTNTIIIQSETNSNNDVVISHAPSSYYDMDVISIDSMSFLTIKDITFNCSGVSYSSSAIMQINKECHDINIKDCQFDGGLLGAIYSPSGAYLNDVVIEGNTINDGKTGIQMRNDGGSQHPNGTGVIIKNNSFIDQSTQAITLISHDDFEISNNSILTPAGINDYFAGIYVSNTDKGGLISNNEMIATGKEGIKLNNLDNSSSEPMRIFNNFISLDGSANGSLILMGYTTSSALVENAFIYNNTLISRKAGINYGVNISKAQNNKIVNNIIHLERGYPIYNGNITDYNNEIDYNSLHATVAEGFMWNGVQINTFDAFQTQSNTNQNSIENNNNFNSLTDYHLCDLNVESAGTPTLTSVTDKEGHVRGNMPDIGADEFEPMINKTISSNGSTLNANQVNASYQWMDCNTNQIIIGATSQSYTTDVSGTYAVIISNGACIDTSDCASVLITSVSNTTSKSFNAYPNPTSGIINIEGLAHTGEYLKIRNITGQLILTRKIVSPTIKIDLTYLPNGIYFAIVHSSQGKESIRIVKK